MAATINGKAVLLNETILFLDGQTVRFDGPFSLSVSANPAAPEGLALDFIDGSFHLSVNGAPSGGSAMYDRIQRGSGMLNGLPFEYLFHVTLSGDLADHRLYRAGLTVYFS